MNETGIGTILGVGFLVLLAWCALGGLIVGALARLVLPGPDPMSWLATIGYGIGGSLLGGFVSRLVGLPQSLGFVMAVAGAAGLIWYFRRRQASG